MTDQEDLLVETRHLLNQLNAENADLKERNRALTNKVREVEDGLHEARRSERDLERDSKQLNFRLMEQVQAKTEEARAAQGREQDAVSRMKDAQRAHEAAAERCADLEARFKVAKEQTRLLEEKLEQERRRANDAEGEVARCRSELESAVGAARDRATSDTRSHQSTKMQLTEQLNDASRRIAALEGALEALELQAAQSAREHVAECARLRSAAQHTLDAEAEAAYAHDQMLSMSDHVTHQLDAQSAAIKMAIRSLTENDAAMAGALRRVSEQQAALRYLSELDDTLRQVLRRGVEEIHESESVSKGEASQLSAAAVDARTAAKREADRAAVAQRRMEQLEGELEECRQQRAASEATLVEERHVAGSLHAEMGRLEGEIAKLRSELHAASERATRAVQQAAAADETAARLRGDLLGQLQTAVNQHRAAAAEWQRREETLRHDLAAISDENSRMRGDLHAHTASLAAELQRLQAGIEAPVSAARPSIARSHHASNILSRPTNTGSLAREQQTVRPSPSRAVALEMSAAADEVLSEARRYSSSPLHAAPGPPAKNDFHSYEVRPHVQSETPTSRSPSPAAAASLAQRILASGSLGPTNLRHRH
jgi:chromosome segregation ATPase